jgi:hypothetical protein
MTTVDPTALGVLVWLTICVWLLIKAKGGAN